MLTTSWLQWRFLTLSARAIGSVKYFPVLVTALSLRGTEVLYLNEYESLAELITLYILWRLLSWFVGYSKFIISPTVFQLLSKIRQAKDVQEFMCFIDLLMTRCKDTKAFILIHLAIWTIFPKNSSFVHQCSSSRNMTVFYLRIIT